MRNTFFYITAFLVMSMLTAQSAEAFWNKQEEAQDSKTGTSGSTVQKQDASGQNYLDVGSEQNVKRLSEEEEEALKAYVEEVQQNVQQTQEGVKAAQLSNQAKGMKAAVTADNTGLDDYQTVKSLEAVQNAKALQSIVTVQKAEPMDQVRRIQGASDQAKKASKAVPQKPAVG